MTLLMHLPKVYIRNIFTSTPNLSPIGESHKRARHTIPRHGLCIQPQIKLLIIDFRIFPAINTTLVFALFLFLRLQQRMQLPRPRHIPVDELSSELDVARGVVDRPGDI